LPGFGLDQARIADSKVSNIRSRPNTKKCLKFTTFSFSPFLLPNSTFDLCTVRSTLKAFCLRSLACLLMHSSDCRHFSAVIWFALSQQSLIQFAVRSNRARSARSEKRPEVTLPTDSLSPHFLVLLLLIFKCRHVPCSSDSARLDSSCPLTFSQSKVLNALICLSTVHFSFATFLFSFNSVRPPFTFGLLLLPTSGRCVTVKRPKALFFFFVLFAANHFRRSVVTLFAFAMQISSKSAATVQITRNRASHFSPFLLVTFNEEDRHFN
jgi:hypothetical protein